MLVFFFFKYLFFSRLFFVVFASLWFLLLKHLKFEFCHASVICSVFTDTKAFADLAADCLGV